MMLAPPSSKRSHDWLVAAATAGGHQIPETDGAELIASCRRAVASTAKRPPVVGKRPRGRPRKHPLPPARAAPPRDDKPPLDLASRLTACDLWKKLVQQFESQLDTVLPSYAPHLLDLLHNEASLNSKEPLHDLANRLGAGEPAQECIRPLFDHPAVGRWFTDVTSQSNEAALIRVLFMLPEDGDDEALWVTGTLLEPGEIKEGEKLPTKYPRWLISEWDKTDLAKAMPQGPPPKEPPSLAIRVGGSSPSMAPVPAVAPAPAVAPVPVAPTAG